MALTISLIDTTVTMAQPGYNQPGYGQPDYDSYDQYDQNYDQSGNFPQDFYDDLAPHGQWVQTPEYGDVWIPNAGPGFQPYSTNGHWVITEYGNTWVSGYAWGWGPFHYGRWYRDRYRGWAWIPGNDWGPAWVSWRSGGGYYGWAPLGPGLNVAVIPALYWTFVPQVYISSPRLFSYCVPRRQAINIYQNTTIINNVYRANNRAYSYGPRREEIEYVTRQRVPVYRIENAGRPGQTTFRENTVGFYRPDLNRGNRAYGNQYPNGREYQPNAGNPNAGTYDGTPRNSRGEGNRHYPQPGESSPGGYQRRNPRYEPQTQPQTQPQPGQLPQPPDSQPQPEIRVPQTDRQQEPALPEQGQWGRGRRQDTNGQNPQRENPQPDNGQLPQQRQSRYEQGGQNQPQNQGQPQPVPGAVPEYRGGSRGPR